MCINFITCTHIEIPLLLNNVDLNQCFYPSCNEQFQYESMPELEKSLMPYNQVNDINHITKSSLLLTLDITVGLVDIF